MKRYLIIGALLASAITSFAQSTMLRVSLYPTEDGFTSGTLVQAYTNCLRNTPGIIVVPKGDPYDCVIEINGMPLNNSLGTCSATPGQTISLGEMATVYLAWESFGQIDKRQPKFGHFHLRGNPSSFTMRSGEGDMRF